MDDDHNESIYHLLLSPGPPPPIWTGAEDKTPDDDAEMLSDLQDYIDSTVMGRTVDDGAEADCSDDATKDAPRTPAHVQEPAEGSSSRPSQGVRKLFENSLVVVDDRPDRLEPIAAQLPGMGRAADDGDAPRTPEDVQEPGEGSSSRPSQGVRKLFENSLVVVDDRPDRLEPIAAQLPSKTPDDDEAMVSYLARIDSGVLGFPDYTDVQEPAAEGNSSRPSQGVRKLFENSLVVVDDRPDQWEPIAAQLPGKSPDDVAEALLSGLALAILALQGKSVGDDGAEADCSGDAPRSTPPPADVQEPAEGSSSRPAKGVRKPRRTYIPKEERKKPVPWEEMEHRLFLRGMQECVKGDWRGISRIWVRTRTPAQVASHAQKFFKRQNGGGKSKRRSIHDITDPYY